VVQHNPTRNVVRDDEVCGGGEKQCARCYRWGAPTGPVDPYFHVEGVAPPTIFFSENYAKW